MTNTRNKWVTVIIYGLKQKARQNYSENARHQQTERINKEPNGEIIEVLSYKTPQEGLNKETRQQKEGTTHMLM